MSYKFVRINISNMIECEFHKITENHFIKSDIESIELLKGDFLFREDEKLGFVYFLCSGELNIIQNELLLWQAFDSEFIGISSFFNNDTHYSTAVKASKKSILFKIAVKSFKAALTEHHELSAKIMRLFCDRIENTSSKSEKTVKYSKKKRLLSVIIEKAEVKGSGNRRILNYTSSELGRLVNVSSRFSKHFIGELQERNLIKLDQKKIEILDLKGLKIVATMKSVLD